MRYFFLIYVQNKLVLHMGLVHIKENRKKKSRNSRLQKYDNGYQHGKVCFPFYTYKIIKVCSLMKILLWVKPMPITTLAHQHKKPKEDVYT